MIGIKQRGGELRFFHAEDAKPGTLAKYIKENVSEDVDVIMTDDCSAYPGAMKTGGTSAERSTRPSTIVQRSTLTETLHERHRIRLLAC